MKPISIIIVLLSAISIACASSQKAATERPASIGQDSNRHKQVIDCGKEQEGRTFRIITRDVEVEVICRPSELPPALEEDEDKIKGPLEGDWPTDDEEDDDRIKGDKEKDERDDDIKDPHPRSRYR